MEANHSFFISASLCYKPRGDEAQNPRAAFKIFLEILSYIPILSPCSWLATMAEWALQVNKPSVHHAQIHDLELTARGLSKPRGCGLKCLEININNLISVASSNARLPNTLPLL